MQVSPDQKLKKYQHKNNKIQHHSIQRKTIYNQPNQFNKNQKISFGTIHNKFYVSNNI